MTVISVKFYKVRMPDGEDYAALGRSIAKVALENGVSQKAVTRGVDTSAVPGVSVYWARQRDKDKDAK